MEMVLFQVSAELIIRSFRIHISDVANIIETACKKWPRNITRKESMAGGKGTLCLASPLCSQEYGQIPRSKRVVESHVSQFEGSRRNHSWICWRKLWYRMCFRCIHWFVQLKDTNMLSPLNELLISTGVVDQIPQKNRRPLNVVDMDCRTEQFCFRNIIQVICHILEITGRSSVKEKIASNREAFYRCP